MSPESTMQAQPTTTPPKKEETKNQTTFLQENWLQEKNKPFQEGRIHMSGPSLETLSCTYPLRLMSPKGQRTQKHRDVFMLSFGGGLVGGDVVDLKVVVDGGASLALLTQGSTKVFKKKDKGNTLQSVRGHIAKDSLLCVLPDPVVPFCEANFISDQTMLIEKEGSLVFLDWMCAGRIQASTHEAWQFARYESRVDLRVACHCESSPNKFKTVARDAWLLGPESEKDAFGATCLGSLVMLGPRVKSLVDAAVAEFENVAISAHTSTLDPKEFAWSLSRLRRKDLCECYCEGHDMDEIVGCVIRFSSKETPAVWDFLSHRIKGLDKITGSETPNHFKVWGA
ncbi:hypothetical protein HDU98_006423 [Podochytrium sp. JEL0797]|nr:hypothetical protein HDU98_006423 [Podochytrium sp. JEL0797]